MAQIRVRAEAGHDAQTIDDPAQQKAFLDQQGLGFDQWPVAPLGEYSGDDEQGFILGFYGDQVERLKQGGGYQTADVIALQPTTPNLDAVLAKFDREHRHSEDEVRFVVDGRGVFTIHSQLDGAIFDVEVEPGDLLVVPEGTWHWFELCEDRTIKCIRLFKDTSGWVPDYLADH
jgi:1,2-dihydroxy-3-keto-5-methylthiopentene dioxygenase